MPTYLGRGMASQERRKDREETVWPGKEGVPRDGCIFDYETGEDDSE